MNGAQFFLLFLVFAWPVGLCALVHFRKRLKIWLWLEGQWEGRKRLLSLGRRKRKVPDERQVLLFPELKTPGEVQLSVNGETQKVKVWS